ncbi:helix-turn-helix transcriptional regulator [Nocardioides sambongensis]|uniref:helix-turn-helix transcriptional regulator n=1 Tax=Nocardioides sambongensis TaxID=2589074 RepID=UPI00112C5658|nr:WYL domain-containing protein [Nocardioides sambongensis]
MTTRAAPGARDQVARLLTLVPLLHQRSRVRLGEAADLLGTTPEQVLGDLRVLFMCGLPGGLPDDLIDVDLDALETAEGGPLADGLIRVENADYLSRPLRLSPTEASAVIVALHTLRAGSAPEVAALVDRVLAKLEVAVAAGTEVRRLSVATAPGEAAVVTLAARLQRAAEEDRQVRLTYHVPSRDELSERVVDPHGVVTSGRFSYLDAWCHLADADRLFRLDRITAATVLDSTRTTPRRAPRDVSDGAFAARGSEGGVLATLRLTPEASWATDYYPVEAVRPASDGSVEVDLRISDPQWLDRLLLRLAPGAEVLAPQEFIETFTASARRTLDLYAQRERTMES